MTGDRQRKLDAVRAAEEAHRAANAKYASAVSKRNDAEDAAEECRMAEREAWRVLTAARREAGL